MKTLLLTIAALGALTLGARATDLTPRYTSVISDGVTISRPYFTDGEKKYGVKVDAETKLTAAEGGALFRFEKFPTATMKMRQSPVPAQAGFGPEALDKYQAAARSLLPVDSADVTLVESLLDPLQINAWQSYRLTYTYHASNIAMRQSFTFLNLKPTEQIVLQTASYGRDFEEISGRAYNIIRRWHEILPEDEERYN